MLYGNNTICLVTISHMTFLTHQCFISVLHCNAMIKFVQIIWILSCVKPIPLRKYFVGSGPVFPTSVWPDLAIFCQLGKILKIFGNFMKVYLVFGKLLNLLWKNQCAFGPIYVVVNGQILSKHFRHLVTPSNIHSAESKQKCSQLYLGFLKADHYHSKQQL